MVISGYTREITVRLANAYFNWIWIHTRKDNTAAQRAGLAAPWIWNDLLTHPTLCGLHY
ncbi:MAG: hypothetical protein J7F05_07705 [Trichodesmium erythraeum GBRTRLIN201]|nr:hypothetical protein [Trichodesmium erythraeum GBRTRLIN201]